MKKLTNEELSKLTNTLEKLESDTLVCNGFHRISGGYAMADMFNYDDEIIDVELKFGIQSDVEDTRYSENVQIDRSTFEVLD